MADIEVKADSLWTNGGRVFKLGARSAGGWLLVDPDSGEACGWLPDERFQDGTHAPAKSAGAKKLTAEYAQHVAAQKPQEPAGSA